MAIQGLDEQIDLIINAKIGKDTYAKLERNFEELSLKGEKAITELQARFKEIARSRTKAANAERDSIRSQIALQEKLQKGYEEQAAVMAKINNIYSASLKTLGQGESVYAKLIGQEHALKTVAEARLRAQASGNQDAQKAVEKQIAMWDKVYDAKRKAGGYNPSNGGNTSGQSAIDRRKAQALEIAKFNTRMVDQRLREEREAFAEASAINKRYDDAKVQEAYTTAKRISDIKEQAIQKDIADAKATRQRELEIARFRFRMLDQRANEEATRREEQRYQGLTGALREMRDAYTGANGASSSFAHKIGTTAAYATAGAAAYAVASGIREAVVATGEFDLAIRTMSAVLDISLVSARTLGEELNSLGAQFGGTLPQIYGVAAALGRAGIATDKLIAATEITLKLSRLTGDTFEESSKAIISYQQVFGDTVSIEELGNKLAFVANKSRLSTQDIGTFSNHALSAAKKIGLTVDAVGALAASFSNAGVNASTIGTQIRRFSSILTDNAGDTVAFFNKVGVVQKNFLRELQQGGAESNAAMVEFGKTLQGLSDEEFTNYVAGMDILATDVLSKLRQNAKEFETLLAGSVNDTAGQLASTEVIMDSFVVTWESFWNKISGIAGEAGTDVGDWFSSEISYLSEYSKIIGNALTQDYTAIQDNAKHIELLDIQKELLTDISVEREVQLRIQQKALTAQFAAQDEAEKASHELKVQSELKHRIFLIDQEIVKLNAEADKDKIAVLKEQRKIALELADKAKKATTKPVESTAPIDFAKSIRDQANLIQELIKGGDRQIEQQQDLEELFRRERDAIKGRILGTKGISDELSASISSLETVVDLQKQLSSLNRERVSLQDKITNAPEEEKKALRDQLGIIDSTIQQLGVLQDESKALSQVRAAAASQALTVRANFEKLSTSTISTLDDEVVKRQALYKLAVNQSKIAEEKLQQDSDNVLLQTSRVKAAVKETTAAKALEKARKAQLVFQFKLASLQDTLDGKDVSKVTLAKQAVTLAQALYDNAELYGSAEKEQLALAKAKVNLLKAQNAETAKLGNLQERLLKAQAQLVKPSGYFNKSFKAQVELNRQGAKVDALTGNESQLQTLEVAVGFYEAQQKFVEAQASDLKSIESTYQSINKSIENSVDSTATWTDNMGGALGFVSDISKSLAKADKATVKNLQAIQIYQDKVAAAGTTIFNTTPEAFAKYTATLAKLQEAATKADTEAKLQAGQEIAQVTADALVSALTDAIATGDWGGVISSVIGSAGGVTASAVSTAISDSLGGGLGGGLAGGFAGAGIGLAFSVLTTGLENLGTDLSEGLSRQYLDNFNTSLIAATQSLTKLGNVGTADTAEYKTLGDEIAKLSNKIAFEKQQLSQQSKEGATVDAVSKFLGNESTKKEEVQALEKSLVSLQTKRNDLVVDILSNNIDLAAKSFTELGTLIDSVTVITERGKEGWAGFYGQFKLADKTVQGIDITKAKQDEKALNDLSAIYKQTNAFTEEQQSQFDALLADDNLAKYKDYKDAIDAYTTSLEASQKTFEDYIAKGRGTTNELQASKLSSSDSFGALAEALGISSSASLNDIVSAIKATSLDELDHLAELQILGSEDTDLLLSIRDYTESIDSVLSTQTATLLGLAGAQGQTSLDAINVQGITTAITAEYAKNNSPTDAANLAQQAMDILRTATDSDLVTIATEEFKNWSEEGRKAINSYVSLVQAQEARIQQATTSVFGAAGEEGKVALQEFNRQLVEFDVQDAFGVSAADATAWFDEIQQKNNNELVALVKSQEWLDYTDAQRQAITATLALKESVVALDDTMSKQYQTIDSKIAELRGNQKETQLVQAARTYTRGAQAAGYDITVTDTLDAFLRASVSQLEEWNKTLTVDGVQLSPDMLSSFSDLMDYRLSQMVDIQQKALDANQELIDATKSSLSTQDSIAKVTQSAIETLKPALQTDGGLAQYKSAFAVAKGLENGNQELFLKAVTEASNQASVLLQEGNFATSQEMVYQQSLAVAQFEEWNKDALSDSEVLKSQLDQLEAIRAELENPTTGPAQLDTNNDGRSDVQVNVDATGNTTGVSAIQQNASQVAGLLKQTNYYGSADTDGNGSLSVAEFQAMSALTQIDYSTLLRGLQEGARAALAGGVNPSTPVSPESSVTFGQLRDVYDSNKDAYGFYKNGGYTGDLGVDSVAGFVHGQEYVVNAQTTRDLGLNGQGGVFKALLAEMRISNQLAIKRTADADRTLTATRTLIDLQEEASA